MRRLDVFQDYGQQTLTVSPGQTVGQTFISRRSNLAGVRFSVSNPRLGGSGEYVFSIADDKQTIIRTLTVKESNLGWQYTFRYDFIPIPDSAGKTYTLNLSFLGDTKVTEAEKGNFLKVAYSAKDLYRDGHALMDKQPIAGDLTFTTYYQASLPIFIRDSLADLRVRLFQDGIFILSYAALLVILFLYLFKRIFRKNKV